MSIRTGALAFSLLHASAAAYRILDVDWSDFVPGLPLDFEFPGGLPDRPSRPVDVVPPQGPRKVAEFEPMQAVMVAWPLGVPMDLIKEFSSNDTVIVLCSSLQCNTALTQMRNAGVNMDAVDTITHGTDSYWTRDYGLWWVETASGDIEAVDFQYDRNRPRDNQVGRAVAEYFGLYPNKYHYMDVAHAGGNMMATGEGAAASTDGVWAYNSNQNHFYSEIESFMGLSRDLYDVAPDPTGTYIKHIDTWAKFLREDLVMMAAVPTSDRRYQAYENAAQRFADSVNGNGDPIRVVRVQTDGSRPYTNALSLNNRIFVPTSARDDATDRAALVAYENALPEYEVIGVRGGPPPIQWLETDALHCRAMGIPAFNKNSRDSRRRR